jgi:hypothetical protein
MARDDSKLPEEDIRSAIQVLERKDLDLLPIDVSNYSPGSAPAWRGGQFDFIRIKAISRSLPEKKADVERYMMEDVLSGLHGLKVPFIYLIIGSRLAINIYLGILNKPVPKPSPSFFLDVLVSSLQGTFPDIEVVPLSIDDMDKNIIQFFKKCSSFGIMTGIPTAKIGVEEQGVEQIERLIRGVYRQEFGYMVIADPVQDNDVVNAFDDIANIIRDKSSLIKEARQYTQTSRVTLSGESLNKSVEYYVELLDLLLEKVKLAKAQGMWRTMSYFFSPSAATTGKMGNLLKTVFSGDKSKPEALRTLVIERGNPTAILSKFKQIELELNFHPAFSAEHPLRNIIKHKFITALNSRDLATLTHLPKEEMPGYDVKDTARFGVCFPEKQITNNLFIGEIIDRGSGTGHYYQIPVTELVKHGLIVGVTGSGKTNTCLGLLDQLWRGSSKIPFLVIEPAKAEYRYLLNVQGFEELQVFTLGDEMTSPFRLNPFEVMEGVKLQSHIDNLRAVFNASFIMYAPMPYVLERCIHEIYKDKGWDLITNQNRFIDVYQKNPYGIFPSLTDLYEKIDPVVEAMGYEDRLTMDIKAGLKARIGSLRIGGKGSMLDTALSLPMDILLSKPTILELQSIGDDEEKSFIIGLLITRLYEYREIESKRVGINTGLRHVTIVEEAHRILTKTSTDLSNLENVNTKAKAVETFCNILSEIRAFGEGIFIAEQIPSKLAQDAIKNSNLKVMHRIVAKDDRDLMGNTMNLNEQQNRFISIMNKGEATVFSEGINEPFLVRIPHYLSSAKVVNPKLSSIQDKDVARFMAKKLIALDPIFGKHSGCKQCQYKCAYRDAANHILSKTEVMKIFKKYIFSIVDKSGNLTSKYHDLKETVLLDIKASLKKEEEVNDIMFCFLINAGERFFQNKGVEYNLPSNKIFSLLNSYNNLINSYFSIPIKTQLSIEAETNLKEFQRCYLQTFSCDKGPFPGCNEFCRNKCLFRFDIEPFVKDMSVNERMLKAIKNVNENDAKIAVRKLCLSVGHNLTDGNSEEFVKNVALCFFIQKSVQWSAREVVQNIQRWFFNLKGVNDERDTGW